MTNYQKIFNNILSENGWDIFSREMLLSDGRLTHAQIKEVLRFILNKGNVLQIERGKFRLSHFADENVIACFMVPDGGIAYWSALNAHGLTEQFPNIIFVQNSSRSEVKKIPGLGTKFRFVKVKPEKITGYKTYGYGNHQYNMTDIEKTIIDCFDLPQYSGGYPEIVKAFNKAKLSAHKMVKYSRTANNIAVTKRLAYLTELLKKNQMGYFLKYAVSVMNNKYSPFDASLPHQGKTVRKWRLIINTDEKEILEMANPII